MDQGERRERRRLFRSEEQNVRAILKRHDPIPGSPDDELDCLEIETLIVHETRNHFGLDAPSQWVRDVAQEAVNWWNHAASRKLQG